MVNAVTSVSNVAASETPRVAVRAPTVEKDVSKDTAPARADVISDDKPISPRISQDAIAAGTLVTQFSDSRGDVTQQVPSQAALAYLRAGLTAQGNAKDDPAASQDDKPAV